MVKYIQIWFNHLDPNIIKYEWTNEEEWILFLQHRRLGNSWSKLSVYLPVNR